MATRQQGLIMKAIRQAVSDCYNVPNQTHLGKSGDPRRTQMNLLKAVNSLGAAKAAVESPSDKATIAVLIESMKKFQEEYLQNVFPWVQKQGKVALESGEPGNIWERNTPYSKWSSDVSYWANNTVDPAMKKILKNVSSSAEMRGFYGSRPKN